MFQVTKRSLQHRLQIGDALHRLVKHKWWTSKVFKTQQISDLNAVPMDCAFLKKAMPLSKQDDQWTISMCVNIESDTNLIFCDVAHNLVMSSKIPNELCIWIRFAQNLFALKVNHKTLTMQVPEPPDTVAVRKVSRHHKFDGNQIGWQLSLSCIALHCLWKMSWQHGAACNTHIGQTAFVDGPSNNCWWFNPRKCKLPLPISFVTIFQWCEFCFSICSRIQTLSNTCQKWFMVWINWVIQQCSQSAFWHDDCIFGNQSFSPFVKNILCFQHWTFLIHSLNWFWFFHFSLFFMWSSFFTGLHFCIVQSMNVQRQTLQTKIGGQTSCHSPFFLFSLLHLKSHHTANDCWQKHISTPLTMMMNCPTLNLTKPRGWWVFCGKSSRITIRWFWRQSTNSFDARWSDAPSLLTVTKSDNGLLEWFFQNCREPEFDRLVFFQRWWKYIYLAFQFEEWVSFPTFFGNQKAPTLELRSPCFRSSTRREDKRKNAFCTDRNSLETYPKVNCEPNLSVHEGIITYFGHQGHTN